MSSVIKSTASTGAALEIKGSDNRFEKNKNANNGTPNKDNRPDNISLEGDNSTSTISVRSIVLFLEDLLETRLNYKLYNNKITQQETFVPWFRAERSNDEVKSKNAAKAYDHAAKALKPKLRNISEEKLRLPIQEELNQIYSLIVDLRQLQNSGVKYLKIDNDKTFIDGIFATVKRLSGRLCK